ncbi:hypothetical protein BLJ79_15945 [Arthrobacter sp. UCD-GKA]|uniref:VOC family protein n=1 Tax=Arthrobacter sp. UCD-GKA TaxID=1913576 RepID=UPI0008DD2167|nr:VOC family protein [Arthrobacter sp. UCD-GKA]OIH83549.1 hypothetical protein BLJ79_15945 [Arthrobacter sp. UCD-GKA]
MAYTFHVTFDCHDLGVMTRFWAIEQGIPPEGWHGTLVDPGGTGPRLFFQPVPEPKMAKNRVHLDIVVAGASSAQRDEQIEAHVPRCIEAGATVLSRSADFVVMADPEGNELCIQ